MVFLMLHGGEYYLAGRWDPSIIPHLFGMSRTILNYFLYIMKSKI